MGPQKPEFRTCKNGNSVRLAVHSIHSNCEDHAGEYDGRTTYDSELYLWADDDALHQSHDRWTWHTVRDGNYEYYDGGDDETDDRSCNTDFHVRTGTGRSYTDRVVVVVVV